MPQTTTAPNKIPLEIWDKIEIVVERDSKQGVYVTRIEDIKNGKIIASRPDFISGKDILTYNDKIYVQYTRPDALYRFGASMQFLGSSANSPVVIGNIGRIERVQRREFVRINLKLDLKYYRIKHKEIGESRPCWHSSKTKDVSAGGMLMSVGKDIEKDDILIVRMPDFEQMGIPRLLSVVCCRVTEINKHNFAGVQFITAEKLKKYISSEELSRLPSQIQNFNVRKQNKMVNYIFERQVEERQKGLAQ